MKRFPAPATLALLLALALALSSCAGLRSTARAAANDDPRGRPAPELHPDNWLQNGEDTTRPELAGTWHLLVFFKPT